MVRIAICRTPFCSNEGIPIEVETSRDSKIICGVCSQPIKDVTNEDDDDDDVEVPPWLA